MRFQDRQQAGRQLAAKLEELRATQHWPDPIVLALPRGGVPVAAEVARTLDAPLDVLVARKIGVPGQPEVGIGAIAGEDPPLFDWRALKMLGISPDELTSDVARERVELHRRESLYRHGRPAPVLHDRTVILVDDGLATGVTARAALRLIRAEHPAALVLAVPVCAARTAEDLGRDTDQVVCLQPHRDLQAVGVWYDDFHQVTDREVIDILEHEHAAG
ncbi:phosphoribosyltransferase [Streptomyces sp. ISL-66]|uniref:phosphoribosyltransferase n=1 Tax=Streptomyces sp. ISL-66 TaxID=2819186 RepID=UPI001BE69A98|nr:phosphoribosyltransferase family protein [Streptomyces sp. ISL-66]MBT2472916.1 phosphoribosyltransferase [Streptomyces sp. ISL-66]